MRDFAIAEMLEEWLLFHSDFEPAVRAVLARAGYSKQTESEEPADLMFHGAAADDAAMDEGIMNE